MSVEVITKPKVQIDSGLLAELMPQTEGQVILHFFFKNNTRFPSYIRIWPTSYLYPIGDPSRSELMHIENICLYPQWQEVAPMSSNFFSLIFSMLPKDCDVFDFIEQCDNEGGAFSIKGIKRNSQDVYYFRIG